MEFAGNNYAYLTKKKLDKMSNLKTPELWSKSEEKDQQLNSNLSKDNNDKLNALMDVVIEEKDKIREDDELSASYESFEDNELNKSYSDDEEEDNNVKNISNTHQTTSNQAPSKMHKKAVDTNILCIKLEALINKNTFATGEPICCSQCKAYLNHLSNLTPNTDNTYLWICEFCDKENVLQIEKEEIPKDSTMNYFIGKETTIAETTKGCMDSYLVYCFDVSGSMSSSIHNAIFQSNCFSNKTTGNGTNIKGQYQSRIECLQRAILNDINILVKEDPEIKVGFVTFESTVIGFGDRNKSRVIIQGQNLHLADTITKIGEHNQSLLSLPVSESQNKLKTLLNSCYPKGGTALGPAMLLSISMIQKTPRGSRILLCTDGEANEGIGSLSQGDAKIFYSSLGKMAKEKGIVINLVTFEDSESSINILMPMIEFSGGEIIRVNQFAINNEFSNILSNKIVATNVDIEIKLHKALQFNNEKTEYLKDNSSTFMKRIGNATKQTELYIEYGFKKSKDIIEMSNCDISNLKKISFQLVINYTNIEGEKCISVITKQQEVTTEKEKIEKQANYDIISTNAIQKSAIIASEGDFRNAQANAYAYKQYIKKQASSNTNAQISYALLTNNFKDFHHNLNQLNAAPMFQQMGQQDLMCQRIHQMKNVSQSNANKFQVQQQQFKQQGIENQRLQMPMNYINLQQAPLNYINQQQAPLNYMNLQQAPLNYMNLQQAPLNYMNQQQAPMNYMNQLPLQNMINYNNNSNKQKQFLQQRPIQQMPMQQQQSLNQQFPPFQQQTIQQNPK